MASTNSGFAVAHTRHQPVLEVDRAPPDQRQPSACNACFSSAATKCNTAQPNFRQTARLVVAIRLPACFLVSDCGSMMTHMCTGPRCVLIAKFHYTDADTDTDFFAAKLRWVRAGPCRVRVRVRVGPVSV